MGNNSNNVELEKLLNVSRRRIKNGKVKRKIFDGIIEKEKNKNVADHPLEKLQSSEESSGDELSTDLEEYYSNIRDTDESGWSASDGSSDENEEVSDGEMKSQEVNESPKKCRRNIFHRVLSPKERKIRDDKLDLGVVCDFCHDVCRLDTFASAKVYVHNYDGTYSYHQVHIKSQPIQCYFEIFQKSPEYHNWQKENMRTKKHGSTTSTIIPTKKLRLFTNAFCPCCMNQKQRDCANHVQINYYNALKAIANLRRYHGISNAIKSCLCRGHQNEHYLRCHISLSSFMDAVLCKKKEYPILSAESDSTTSIEKQEKMNILLSHNKQETALNTKKMKENRNIKREGIARQPKSIPLLSWGPLFTCYSKECAYHQCTECGIDNFFSDSNMCDIERNKDVEVIVRKYENVLGRSRGMQYEIIEVKMNGDEVVEHLIHCAKLAIPHEWNVKWNAHARTVCVNTSFSEVLTLMTDFSAVLDHDVQDRLNTAVPCRSNQCIFLATHSPRNVQLKNGMKKIQDNDLWHIWSAQGGMIEVNSYYHSVSTRHIVNEYSQLNLTRINIFTDGCAEQYKSRRNAYFVAALAEDYDVVVTHNYAPTASFKTMVDGQGNVTKAFYRKLERSEEEGTRCSTSFDLFKLFTSRYKMTPDAVDNLQRNPMTITRRFHRFIVDKTDATPEMVERAKHEKDVIITDYLGERWDAPPVKGIKGIFNLIAYKEEGQIKMFSRQHSCFCIRCIANDFKRCEYSAISGQLREEQVKKLPFKENTLPKSYSSDDIKKINFFKGALPSNSGANIIVAIPCEKKDISDEPFVLGLMTKIIKESQRDIESEYSINSVRMKTTIKKGTWCITLKLMYCQNVNENDFYIPVRSKEIKIPLHDIYYPVDDSEFTRENYLQCCTQTKILGGNQVSNIYTVDNDCLDKLRKSLTDDL